LQLAFEGGQYLSDSSLTVIEVI